jgi:hypothetical protein
MDESKESFGEEKIKSISVCNQNNDTLCVGVAAKMMRNECLDGVPVLVVANKKDKPVRALATAVTT